MYERKRIFLRGYVYKGGYVCVSGMLRVGNVRLLECAGFPIVVSLSPTILTT
jgi:hypothetical protein